MSAAGKTYRAKRNGRLGFVHAWLNPTREVRDVRATLHTERMMAEQARIDAIERESMLRSEVELLAALAKADAGRIDALTDELTRALDALDQASDLASRVETLEALIDDAHDLLNDVGTTWYQRYSAYWASVKGEVGS